MARGWESKSVEEQQAEVRDAAVRPKGPANPEDRARAQQRQTLRLQLSRVDQQLKVAQTPAHREMLTRAKADLERMLTELG